MTNERREKARKARELKRQQRQNKINTEIERLLSDFSPFSFPHHSALKLLSQEYLRELTKHVEIFFGFNGESAAHFLFLVWQFCHGDAFDDPKEGLEYFKHTVSKAINKDEKRGRKEDLLTKEVKKARAEGKTYRQALKELAPNWNDLDVVAQQRMITQIGDRVRKSYRRAKKKKSHKK